MKDGRLSHILKNRLDATCFQHDSVYAKYKYRLNRKQSDIVLTNKALKIGTDPRVNGYQRGLASMVYKFFNERTKGSGINLKANSLNNEILAEKLHKSIIKNFKRRKVYSSFKDNIWGVDLFSRYAWVIPLKNKKGESIVERFKKILNNSNRKPNKIWADHGSECYNNKFKSF